MDLSRYRILSDTQSRSKSAIEFLKKDKARFMTRYTQPMPAAVIEQRRKQIVSKRFRNFLLVRQKAATAAEKEIIKMPEIAKSVLEELKLKPSNQTLGQQLSSSRKSLLPWPGFRYHNNGDIRKLSQTEKQRRMMNCSIASLSPALSVPEFSSLASVGSRLDVEDDQSYPVRFKRSGSDGGLNAVSSVVGLKGVSSVVGLKGVSSAGGLKGVSSAGGLKGVSSNPVASMVYSEGHPQQSREHVTRHLHPSQDLEANFRKVSARRNSSCRSETALRPVKTSSLWCHGGEALSQRAALIPKDSFNIKFGVSSQVLHERKSDLDAYKNIQMEKEIEIDKDIDYFIENITRKVRATKKGSSSRQALLDLSS